MGSGAGDAPTASTSVASQRVLRTRVAALSSGQTISGEMVRPAALEAPLSGRHRRTPHSGPPGAQARVRRVHRSFIGDYGSGAGKDLAQPEILHSRSRPEQLADVLWQAGDEGARQGLLGNPTKQRR
ncbi:conserved hypothetical protein [Trichinella spiralis]|uniref:hypothetical protein n=1 Tax=Trichinella spiralis TaxID=6334 RepID=UPI0001EFDC4E|nr:conserved hypothetical protein [Trichinella spiralis]